jgi:hypothetical protein
MRKDQKPTQVYVYCKARPIFNRDHLLWVFLSNVSVTITAFNFQQDPTSISSLRLVTSEICIW